jgi:Protein of unknown function (DUF3000)
MTADASGPGMSRGEPATVPTVFSEVVRSLHGAAVRPEVQVAAIRPPQRLAPWSHAVSLDVRHGSVEAATGRLVLLHDPAGYQAWQGTLRLVGYGTADLDPEMAGDPLLPEVGWSWLLDALADQGARYTAAGGTVTQTASTRFGDIAGPRWASGMELRASWTPIGLDLSGHLRAWADLLCTAAGLPPPGVAVLPVSGLGARCPEG